MYIYTHTAHTHFPLSSEFMNEAELKNLLQMIKSGILPGTYAYYTLIEREGGGKTITDYVISFFSLLLSTHIKVSLSFFFPVEA